VLIVEGEKTLDAAAQYTPEGWVVVTWSGGASAWDKSDWSVLNGHPCIIWPDNDEPGMKATASIQMHLSKLKIATAVIAIHATCAMAPLPTIATAAVWAMPTITVVHAKHAPRR
jgi:DNA primase